MGWLTGYTYRMSAPVANPSTAGNRAIDALAFPAWFLKSQGKILGAGYEDVRVTKSDGTTELPCELNTEKTALYVDYASMPQGRTTLYIYYGKEGASAPTACSYYTTARGVAGIVSGDTGAAGDDFDAGVAGQALSGWTGRSVNTAGFAPTAVYNHADVPRSLSAMEAKITANANTGNYSGVYNNDSAGMTANTAEYRFWLRVPSGMTSSQVVFISDSASTVAGMTWLMDWSGATGQIRFMNASSQLVDIAAFNTNVWEQYRLVFNFTSKTFSVSRRSTGDWTVLKSDCAFCKNTATQTNGIFFAGLGGNTFYVDEVEYANAGITDPASASTTVQAFPADHETTEGGSTVRCYLWGRDLEDTSIQQNAATAYYGGSTTHAIGHAAAASSEKRYLVKPFIGRLPKGTVSEAKLHLYAASTGFTGGGTLYCHKLATVGASGADPWPEETVGSGWSVNDTGSTPTWNTRFIDYQASAPGTARGWYNAEAGCGASSYDAAHDDVTLAAGFTAGYKAIPLTASTVSDQVNTDGWAQGWIVRPGFANSGANNYVTVDGYLGTNKPVLEVLYSALDVNQLSKRKLSTNTYTYATFSTQERYAVSADANQFAVQAYCNAEMKMDVCFIDSDGRICRAAENQAPSGQRGNYEGQLGGLYYDATDGRYWTLLNTYTANRLAVGYSAPYDPTTWTYASHASLSFYKGQMTAKDGVAYIGTYTGSQFVFLTFTQSSGAWSSATEVANATRVGTSTLASGINSTDVMSGSGTIALVSATSYPTRGMVNIGSEAFLYTGKSGNNLTGVTRGLYGTTAATYAGGTTVTYNGGGNYYAPTYIALTHDPVRDCFHMVWCENDSANGSNRYLAVGYARYYYGTSAWKDHADNALTLPLQNDDTPYAQAPGDVAYPMDLSVLDDGTVLLFYGDIANKLLANRNASHHTELVCARIAPAGTAWTYRTIGTMSEASAVEAGSHVVVTGVSNGTTVWSSSTDGGDTFDSVATRSTYSIPYVYSADIELWLSSNTARGNLDGGRGIVYAFHDANHGALYIESAEYPQEMNGSFPTLRSVEESMDGGFPTVRVLVGPSGLTGSFRATRITNVQAGILGSFGVMLSTSDALTGEAPTVRVVSANEEGWRERSASMTAWRER